MIEIDGSRGEGGGQILRTSLALSVLTGKPFKLFNIRANRAKPGLQPQHLMCVKAAGAICGANFKGAAVGSSVLYFEPGEVKSGEYLFTIGTAGAPVTETCQLGAAAGPMLIAFRLMTDAAAEFDGWHVKDITLDGVAVGTGGSIAGWDNEKFFAPLPLSFAFTLVGINGTVNGFGDVTAGTSVKVFRPTLSAGNDYTLSLADRTALAGYADVVAIVSGIPASESSTLYQPYSLMVNGTERADGA